MERRPNILYIVVDCLRADRAFDPTRTAQTPNLDRLRQGGTLFSHLITANSLTIPCMTTTFSGMYPRHHGVRAMKSARIADGYKLLAEVLYDHGYHTYAEATGPLNPFFRLNRGFAPAYQHVVELAFSLDLPDTARTYAEWYLALNSRREDVSTIGMALRMAHPAPLARLAGDGGAHRARPGEA